MHALIVVAHPEQHSHTHAVAAQVGEALLASGGAHTFEVADLAQEGFDPRFTQADVALYAGKAGAPPDVAAEQARLDRADALVLVFPIYWWSFPALLKGWIDRVFAVGWAFDEDADSGKIVKKLGRLGVHVVAIGGADERTYARHGYFGAMKTQIHHGIFDFCGARVQTSELMVVPDADFPQSHYATARAIGGRLFETKA
ncbi:NAD(P)H-dependent oxidoreductase [Xanthomonas hortorum pv. vitians]|uniref:Glutathione-regulated potassium-efflux system ancillary protein KefF n=1 Tax=Xanthomonas hortorum pv. vitians TaxID=83224 RepID=A0A6V7BTV7_9XANT|nr:NAD(P)H-dependent oxidoreductase [Xanthomonas hortorum]APP82929.1 NAD(P)H oxidoreductase [Xanthomonas hortorum pv. gardneri]ASW47299.1 NAD(P)H oxidoreductase [Xanthomonas hortorum]MCC8493712.1 NAD(P)H-dependent oxidoreductase [Xanthomonas hortorum pv. gardneri]MCE4279183.1 NAD(P)H-dependent oxidoreductase [Xanthomonas hortorum pv. vitians]MCE4283569.1 NAD(P)H-dependent oxidoreductase [Xanthomonas hortorum pv. vitians]